MSILAAPALWIVAPLLALTVASSLPPDVEREAREIETMLIAPCCYSQQVSVHQSAAADEMRRDIRAQLEAGATRDQILDAYAARYGKRILAQPPAEGFDLALYVAPLLVLLASVALVATVVVRFTGRTAPSPTARDDHRSPGEPELELQHRLDDELRDMD